MQLSLYESLGFGALTPCRFIVLHPRGCGESSRSQHSAGFFVWPPTSLLASYQWLSRATQINFPNINLTVSLPQLKRFNCLSDQVQAPERASLTHSFIASVPVSHYSKTELLLTPRIQLGCPPLLSEVFSNLCSSDIRSPFYMPSWAYVSHIL